MKLLEQALLVSQHVLRLATTAETACTLPVPFNSVTGTCMSVSSCTGFSTPTGRCPGAADVQCCTDTFAPPSEDSTGAASDLGISLIHSFEGYRDQFYCDRTHKPPVGGGRHCDFDEEGNLSIAWGHLCRPESSCDWIQVPFAQNPDGDKLFNRDLQTFVSCTNRLVTVPLTQNQFDALVDFAYNAGCGTLGRVATKLNAGDTDGALAFIRSWNNGGVLTRRRVMEINLFNS